MKRSITVFLGLLMIFALSQDSPAQRARIEFKEEVVDFGELQEGEVVEHLFIFSNTGDAPLQIFDTFAD